jgi:FlgD Ig-like domain
MKSKNYLQRSSIITGLALALALATAAPSAHANVFASNIKINGTLTGSATVFQGSAATITYVLNEPASQGVVVKIFSGATLVRTIAIAGGSAGTTQGLNTVVWDGKNDSNVNVTPGNYIVQVSASSTGYLEWTQIQTNTNPKVFWPAGIAVDTSTNSAYYGRVMVANGVNTTNNVAPHPVGILKFNSDGSEADEGQSNAGNPFRTDAYLGDSCRSLKYGTDDRVYYDDWVGNGKVTACDMIMSTNQLIFNADLNPTLGVLSSGMADIDVTDPGTTNALVWLADADYPSVGVFAFPLTNNGVADSTSAGFNVLGTGPNIPLRSGFGMMIDESGDVFIGEVRSNPGDVNPRAICITNVWGASLGYPTNWWNTAEAFPITSTDLNWAVGQSDDTFRSVSAVAIDSRTSPKYVACAMNGGSGGLRILNAADGTVVTNINQDVSVNYIGTCFDKVGNVYVGSANATNPWSVFSPPGTNQATTHAVATVQVTVAPTQPHIGKISVSGGTVTIQFTGGASDPASAFTLLSSGTVNGTYGSTAGASITGSAGSYQATAPTSGGMQFYRIKR